MARAINLWNHGVHLGKELLGIEFKIISFHSLAEHLPELIEKKTFTGIHNNLVHQSVITTVKKYFAKYFSAMSRTNIDDNFGRLYLGVNDDGFITGIPVTTLLEKTKIKTIIDEIIRNNIRGIHNGKVCDDTKKFFSEKIIINIYDVDHEVDSSNDFSLDEFIDQIECEEIEHEQLWRIYLDEINQWRQHLAKYNVKLSILSNDPDLKEELLAYCIENNANNEIISMLKSGEEIKIERGVADRKHDPNNFDYWVANFKEIMLHKFNRPSKPIRPSIFGRERLRHCLNNPLQMGKYWKQVRYQFIEIVLPMNTHEDRWIEYLDGSEWVSRVRKIKSTGDPCCVKI